MKMKIAVTGSTGQIGGKLVSLFAIPLNINLLDKDSINREVKYVDPDVIIHCAGISSIEECEKDYDKAMSVNVWGTRSLCEVAENKVVLLSSEQVFDGTKISNTEQDEPNPINVYGMSKYAAEGVTHAFGGKVIRLSRVFSNLPSSDIYKYIEKIGNGEDIIIPSFIYRNYSHVNYIAAAIWEYANIFKDMPEILNIGSSRTISFYEFMSLIIKKMELDRSLIKPRAKPEEGYAARPFMCGLDTSLAKALGITIRSIEDSVDLFVRQMK